MLQTILRRTLHQRAWCRVSRPFSSAGLTILDSGAAVAAPGAGPSGGALTAAAAGRSPTPFYRNRFAAAYGWNENKYNFVPIRREPLTEVLREVPNVPYYYVGDPDPKPYPYRDVRLSEPLPAADADYGPAPVPAPQLPNAGMRLSRLDNGLRIVSIDKGGYVSNVGLFVNAGSRHETPESLGCSRFIEHMAWHATAHLSWLRTVKALEAMAATASCTAAREHILWQVEVERHFVPIVIPLITGNVIFPRFLSWETNRKAQEFMYEVRRLHELNLEATMTELVHATAYRKNTLGQRIFPHVKDMANFTPGNLRQFLIEHASPDRMVLVGVNVEPDDFVKWAARAFADYETVPPSTKEEIPANYTGGEHRVEAAAEPNAHVILAFETPGGWNGKNLMATTVLQTILGGGGSFSTGGPGKGMYTRLYQEVLCNHWVESCVAFNTQYSDSGIFGLYMIAAKAQSYRMLGLIANQLRRLKTPPAKDELQRAKNSLKSSVCMNLESRSVVLEDMGRQLLMSGKILTGPELCAEIDKVTASDVAAAGKALLATPPTLVVRGDIDDLPTLAMVNQELKQSLS